MFYFTDEVYNKFRQYKICVSYARRGECRIPNCLYNHPEYLSKGVPSDITPSGVIRMVLALRAGQSSSAPPGIAASAQSDQPQDVRAYATKN